MQYTGAKILMECLLEQETDTVFGYPGAAIINVYDELHRYRRRIRHVLTAHEQGAAHAADGYARSTGRVGVCLATSGPGATNLVTGIAAAYMDSSPVVFITCNVSEGLIGRDSFQEVDITGITMPITKCTFFVKSAAELADCVREAFAVARSGRPGPVLIDIPKNVTTERAPYTPLPRRDHYNHGRLASLLAHTTQAFTPPEPDEDDLAQVADMLAHAERPLILCGGGVVRARAQKELVALATKADAPVAYTVMGCGGIPGRHPLATGLIGMHGSLASNHACDQCDLLLAIGCRFSDRVAISPADFAPRAKIVQIDIDRAEIDKNVLTTRHIIGDARRVTAFLTSRIPPCDHADWKRLVFSRPTAPEYPDHGDALDPRRVCDAIARLAPPDTIVATDVGQHQMWCIQNFKFDYPGQLLTSGGFGAMGFGLGAAIGARLGNPGRTVIHVTGDGSFRMNCNELATVAQLKLPVITIVFNNHALGMVRQWQRLTLGRRYSATTLGRSPDFPRLARAYGLAGFRARTVPQLEEALRKALQSPRGTVIDCAIQPDELVRPMVQDGQSLTSFLLR